MKKNTKTKSKLQKIPFLQRTMTRKQFILLCYVPMAIVTGLFIMAGVYFREYYKTSLEEPSVIRHFIVEAVEGLSSEAPIVPTNNKQYIPEMGLSFDRSTTKLAYFYSPKSDDAHETATITSTAIKNSSSVNMYSFQNTEDLLNAVPEYQQCNRVLIITTEDKTPTFHGDYNKIDTITTTASPLYVWQNTERLCKAADGSNLEELLRTVRTAQSYSITEL